MMDKIARYHNSGRFLWSGECRSPRHAHKLVSLSLDKNEKNKHQGLSDRNGPTKTAKCGAAAIWDRAGKDQRCASPREARSRASGLLMWVLFSLHKEPALALFRC
jgi:hypothetical protein